MEDKKMKNGLQHEEVKKEAAHEHESSKKGAVGHKQENKWEESEDKKRKEEM